MANDKNLPAQARRKNKRAGASKDSFFKFGKEAKLANEKIQSRLDLKAALKDEKPVKVPKRPTAKRKLPPLEKVKVGPVKDFKTAAPLKASKKSTPSVPKYKAAPETKPTKRVQKSNDYTYLEENTRYKP